MPPSRPAAIVPWDIPASRVDKQEVKMRSAKKEISSGAQEQFSRHTKEVTQNKQVAVREGKVQLLGREQELWYLRYPLEQAKDKV